MMKQLRVLARGNQLVLDAAYAQVTGRRSYIGREAVSSWDLDSLPEDEPRHECTTGDFVSPSMPHVAYPKRKSPTTVDNNAYVRKAVQRGSLWPADAETAAECMAPFDPEFGGEYAVAKSHRRKEG